MLFSGALTTSNKEKRTIDDEGVSCTVCHSITDARLDGTGSYTIRRPALLVKKDGEPVYENVSDEDILENVQDHKRAMMRDILRKPEFCATCHKASAPPSLNNYKNIRGFNAYDEWQQSGASGESITPFYRHEKRADCRTCHMPLTSEGKPDMAATDKGLVASHRFIGANTATPLFYGQNKQVELTKRFLENNVLSADIFAVRNETSGEVYYSLEQNSKNKLVWKNKEQILAEVVIFNRRAAHSFPPELRDMYEPWVEFEAIDNKGNTIYHSGFVKSDGTLDEKAHVYKAILLDSFSKVITRHQVWTSAIKAYDNFIPSGRGDIVRFRFSIPERINAITIRAKVNYRRFNHEYTDYVLKRNNAGDMEMPIVKMAETSITLVNNNEEAKIKSENKNEAKRWNDYGIGLLEQSQNSQAAFAFRKASEIDPKNADYLVSAAIAEFRMERFAFGELHQLKKAEILIANALQISPKHLRTQFYQAINLRALGRAKEEVRIFAKLARDYPRDRKVQRELGQTLYALGDLKKAQNAFETILKIDPTDAESWKFLQPIYAGTGKTIESERARQNYLLWRDDPLAESVATTFFQQNPNWANVRIQASVYSQDSPQRPIAIGEMASPIK